MSCPPNTSNCPPLSFQKKRKIRHILWHFYRYCCFRTVPIILSSAHLDTFSLRYARSRQCSLKLQVFCLLIPDTVLAHMAVPAGQQQSSLQIKKTKTLSLFTVRKAHLPCKIRTAPLQITTGFLHICALGEFNRADTRDQKLGVSPCSLLQTQSEQFLQGNTKVRKDTFLVTLLCI